MTLSFDPKEELHLRMADLEKKLAQSVEERWKLEKTCNILMRAFREEEKIRYKALNKNYEKFLQDCTVRKRRNDIILRSLCRIEDRSRALFAKTERLKLLKDRYIAYLKIADIKEEISFCAQKTPPPYSSSPKTVRDVSPKFVQWKNPLAADYGVSDLKNVEENSNRKNKRSDFTSLDILLDSPHAKYEKRNQEKRAEEDGKEIEIDTFEGFSSPQVHVRCFNAQNKLCRVETRLDSALGHSSPVSVRNEEIIETENRENLENYCVSKNDISNELEVKDLTETAISQKEINILSHQEAVKKLNEAFLIEEEVPDNENNNERYDPYDIRTSEKDGRELSQKNLVKMQNDTENVSLHRINHYSMTSISNSSPEEKKENLLNDDGIEMKAESLGGNLPLGLDGIDYQNETYPESYYEQPVHHHNHTSIVADVILEEDETEQDVDEEDKDIFEESQILSKDSRLEASTWKESPENRTDKLSGESQQNWKDKTKLIDEVHDLREKAISEVKSQDLNLEKLSLGKSLDFEGSESKSEKSEGNLERKKNVRSNLIHMLESDSESFQIEHGEAVSGNEDSDFDFSFQ